MNKTMNIVTIILFCVVTTVAQAQSNQYEKISPTILYETYSINLNNRGCQISKAQLDRYMALDVGLTILDGYEKYCNKSAVSDLNTNLSSYARLKIVASLTPRMCLASDDERLRYNSDVEIYRVTALKGNCKEQLYRDSLGLISESGYHL